MAAFLPPAPAPVAARPPVHPPGDGEALQRLQAEVDRLLAEKATLTENDDRRRVAELEYLQQIRELQNKLLEAHEELANAEAAAAAQVSD